MRNPTDRGLAVAALMLLLACGSGADRAERIVTVRTAVLERGPISSTVMLPCRLEGADEAVISVPEPVMVSRVLVSEGDPVIAGAVMVELETDMARFSAVSAAAARVAAATALHDYSLAGLERASSLLDAGAMSERGHEAAQQQEAASEAALLAARSGYERAAADASTGIVRAPFSGTVTRVWARQGNPASGGLVAISGGRTVQAELLFPPGRLPFLKAGLPVFLHASIYPGEIFPGVITEVSPSVDPLSGLVAARAQFQNEDRRLAAGLSGIAETALETCDSALVLPRSCLERNPDGGWRAAVVEGGRAVFRSVETGLQNGFRMQITSGLSAGDSVIVFGINTVREGDRVREAAR